MYKSVKILLLVFCLAISGCKSALLEIKHDNQRITESISRKQSELAELKDIHQQFLNEKNKLLSELNQKNITLDELSAQIDKLKTANSQINAVTDAEQNKKTELSRNLDEYSRKIKALSSNNHLNIEEKKRRNEELKQQIRNIMERDLELY